MMILKNKLFNFWAGLFQAGFLYGIGGGKGGGSSQQDTSMSRKGNTHVRAAHKPSSGIRNIDTSAFGAMTNDRTGQRTGNELANQSFNTSGVGNLRTFLDSGQADITNPTYENTTNAAFDNRLSRALAVARTGEANVLAPVARGDSFREADAIQQQLNTRQVEIEQQRELDFRKLLEGATGMGAMRNAGAGTSDAAKAATLMPAEAMSKFLAPFETDTAESITGRGAQTASGQSWGVQGGASCCFIFLEVYNGELPKHVRECRDEFADNDTDRRNGYIWMASWLVPAMKKSKLVRWLVNKTMVQPLTEWGGWYKRVDGYENHANKFIFVEFWFKTWEVLGKWV